MLGTISIWTLSILGQAAANPEVEELVKAYKANRDAFRVVTVEFRQRNGHGTLKGDFSMDWEEHAEGSGRLMVEGGRALAEITFPASEVERFTVHQPDGTSEVRHVTGIAFMTDGQRTYNPWAHSIDHARKDDFAGFILACDLGDHFTRAERVEEGVREGTASVRIEPDGASTLIVNRGTGRLNVTCEYTFSREFPGALTRMKTRYRDGDESTRHFLDLKARDGGGVFPDRIVCVSKRHISESVMKDVECREPPGERFAIELPEAAPILDLIRGVRIEPATRWHIDVLSNPPAGKPIVIRR